MKQRSLGNNDQVIEAISIQEKMYGKVIPSHSHLRAIRKIHRKNCKRILWAIVIFFILISLCFSYYYLRQFYAYLYDVKSVTDETFASFTEPATDKDYYITRPNGRNDGRGVRVMFVIASNRTDQTLCYAVASAYFANIPIVVSGYKQENYENPQKPSIFMSAVDEAGLQGSDVVIALDSDIMFTGLDYFPFLDKFIKLSPANFNELDVKAIRTGQMMAPSTYTAEKNCFSEQALPPEGAKCHTAYEQIYLKHRKYVNSLTEFAERPFVNYDDNKLQHLNSGTSIHRVWSMRKVFAAFYRFMPDNIPVDNKQWWWCDQSAFAKLYLELRLWEIQQDYFRKSTDELRTMSNEYGLYAGLMGLDLKGELSVMGKIELDKEMYELTTEHWQTGTTKKYEVIKLYDVNRDLFVQTLYNKTDVKKVFTQRKLTRSYSNVHSVTIAPPMLSVVPRHINGKDKPAERVFPLIMHFAGAKKEERVKTAFSYMQWSLPMMFDKEEWKRGKQYTMSMPIDLWTYSGDKLRLQYSDVCEKFDLFDDIH